MKRTNRKITILKKLYTTGLHLTATDFKISNANQFLIELENQKLIERYWVKDEGITPFKLAYVSDDTREKAEKYLNIFQEAEPKEKKLPKSA